jgi:hypothetical protein
VLVVVEHRDLHALAQLAFDIEAVGRLDVFEVDAAKGGLQRGDDVHQLVEVVLLVDLDVEHVDAGELLEQHALAFHHRLARQRADVAQAQHGRAVGDHRHQVAAAGVFEGVVGVFGNFLARRGNTGRVGQRQVVLVDQLLGGRDGNLAGGGNWWYSRAARRNWARFSSAFSFSAGILVSCAGGSGLAGPPVLSGWGGRL